MWIHHDWTDWVQPIYFAQVYFQGICCLWRISAHEDIGRISVRENKISVDWMINSNSRNRMYNTLFTCMCKTLTSESSVWWRTLVKKLLLWWDVLVLVDLRLLPEEGSDSKSSPQSYLHAWWVLERWGYWLKAFCMSPPHFLYGCAYLPTPPPPPSLMWPTLSIYHGCWWKSMELRARFLTAPLWYIWSD